MPTGIYPRINKTKLPIIPIGPSIAYIPLTKGLYSIVDIEDVPLIGTFKWYADNCGGRTAPYAKKAPRPESTEISLARLILQAPKGKDVDHINRNTLDNRRCNLRICTRQQNSMNRTRRGNSTGYRGVISSKYDRFYSTVVVNGIPHNTGGHASAKEAHDAYLELAKTLHGEFFSG